MPSVISNPASFSSVRTAFNAEGYGISDSFFAYRQGGGIVPATSPFNGIGAGTVGDPLQLSQFNGFSVPSFEIINISNHNVYTQRIAYGDGQSSALSQLTLSSTGTLSLLGSTAYFPLFQVEGSILINGNDYFNNTLAGSTSGQVAQSNQWLQSGTASLYSARATIISGGTTSGSNETLTGTYGSWQALTSTRTFGVECNTNTGTRNGALSVVFTLDIALTSNLSNILDTATITLEAVSGTNQGDPP
jgi:hypothetical protein